MSAKKKAKRENENMEDINEEENKNRKTHFNEQFYNENKTMTILPKYVEIEEKSNLIFI